MCILSGGIGDQYRLVQFSSPFFKVSTGSMARIKEDVQHLHSLDDIRNKREVVFYQPWMQNSCGDYVFKEECTVKKIMQFIIKLTI